MNKYKICFVDNAVAHIWNATDLAMDETGAITFNAEGFKFAVSKGSVKSIYSYDKKLKKPIMTADEFCSMFRANANCL